MGEEVKRFITGLPTQHKVWVIELIDACVKLLLTFQEFTDLVIKATNNSAITKEAWDNFLAA